jgi:hypothetical protein
MDLVSLQSPHLSPHLFHPPPRLFNSTLLNPRSQHAGEPCWSILDWRVGGTQSLGTFSFKEPPTITGLRNHIRIRGWFSFLSHHSNGSTRAVQVPLYGCVWFATNRAETFPQANYAAEMGVSDQVGKLSEEEITVRRSRGSMIVGRTQI